LRGCGWAYRKMIRLNIWFLDFKYITMFVVYVKKSQLKTLLYILDKKGMYEKNRIRNFADKEDKELAVMVINKWKTFLIFVKEKGWEKNTIYAAQAYTLFESLEDYVVKTNVDLNKIKEEMDKEKTKKKTTKIKTQPKKRWRKPKTETKK